MGRVLNDNTVVRNPKTTKVVVLHAGTVVPAWADDLVGEHLTVAGGNSAGGGEPVAPPAEDDAGGGEVLVEPPRAGRGSGLEAWKAYAESLDIEVPDDATRDELVELVDAQS